MYSEVIQLYINMYLYAFKFFSHLDYYRILSRVPKGAMMSVVKSLGFPFLLSASSFYIVFLIIIRSSEN